MRINDKQLFFDDDYFFSYEVNEKSRVLVIDGENAVRNIAYVYALDDYYAVQSISENAFTNDQLSKTDFVVLNGLNTISSATIASLVSFAKEGGTIALFPGENINFQAWNSLLQQLSLPRLTALQSVGVKVKSIQSNDAFFNGVFEKKPTDLNLPLQTKIYMSSGGSSLPMITLQNGLPLFVRSNSTTRAYLFCSSLTPSFGNFTSNALFSTLVLRMAELSQRTIPIALTIGADARFPLFNAPVDESPIHLVSPSVDFIPRTERINQRTYLSIAGMEAIALKAGLYSIKAEDELGTVALNYNRTESDVSLLTAAEISAGFADQGIENTQFSTIDEGQSLTRIDLEKPKEYWRIFVVLALLFLLTEMALLKFLK